MKLKASDLAGAALDWAVATCEGVPLVKNPFGANYSPGYWVHFGGIVGGDYRKCGGKYSPSTNWAQGGPIVDAQRLKLTPRFPHHPDWEAEFRFPAGGGANAFGPTPLIAAMRCYVISRLGQEVEEPEGLA